jgi:nicotinate phosphoribosyltransferase
MQADLITIYDEIIDTSQPLTIFDPIATWKTKTYRDYHMEPLLITMFENGVSVYNRPTLHDIKAYVKQQIDCIWDEMKRFDHPHKYYVDLSQRLYDLKQNMLKKQPQ